MPTGRELLRAWIDRMGFNQREAALFIGCHYVVLSQWLSGARSPELASAINIERRTGIPVESWLLSPVSEDPDDAPITTDKRKIASR